MYTQSLLFVHPEGNGNRVLFYFKEESILCTFFIVLSVGSPPLDSYTPLPYSTAAGF